jgi:hypothetical protein
MRPPLALAPLFALPLLLVAGRARAADPPAKEDSVQVTVAVILASADGTVDDRLKCVACEVHKLHPKLNGFHLGTTTTHCVSLGKSATFPLVDGQEASVTVKRCTEYPGRYCLEVKSKALVGEMTYSSVCGKYFPLVTGYKTKDNKDQLIIAFKVESCADKDRPKDKGKEKK